MAQVTSLPSNAIDPSACCRDTSHCEGDFIRYRSHRSLLSRNDLVLRHQWLAVVQARRFRDRGQSVDDLSQVAMIGLIKAIERFDPTRGVPFRSYAAPTIAGELKRHFRDHSWDVSVPRRAKEARTAVTHAGDVLHQRLHRAPTPDELAAQLAVPRGVVVDTLAAAAAHRAYRLEARTGPGVEPAVDGQWTDVADDRVMTLAAVRKLPERDRLLLYWRFVDDCTQEEIAGRIGVSQVQVSRRLTASCAALRQILAAAS